jgi:hypothetical protein
VTDRGPGSGGSLAGMPDEDESLPAHWRDAQGRREAPSQEPHDFLSDRTLGVDVDQLLKLHPNADADLVRSIVAARALLVEQLGPRYSSALTVIGPLLVAVRALQHALHLALGREPDDLQGRRRDISAAALVVITGGATLSVMQNLRGLGAVAYAVNGVLRTFLVQWLVEAQTRHDVAALWDTAALIISPLLPRAPRPGTSESRRLVRDAARALLPQHHPKRTRNASAERREWGEYLAALLRAGGIDVSPGKGIEEAGVNVKVALHSYREKVPRHR